MSEPMTEAEFFDYLAMPDAYTPHDHREYVEGCFRCDLSREEGRP